VGLRAGDWVEVRSKEEILKSLDKNGRLDGLPFMPQMFQYCGRQFSVYKRAHKTCDTITNIWPSNTVGRSLSGAVHLALRCDGKAYGGCDAACLIFWKEAWLKPVKKESGSNGATVLSTPPSTPSKPAGEWCSELDVWKATRANVQHTGDEPQYVCQATRLLDFTKVLPWWDFRQYVEDYTSANTTLGALFQGLAYVLFWHIGQAWRARAGIPSRWLYDRFQTLYGGVPFPRKKGTIPVGQLTPTCDLNLQPGEVVRVKSYDDILATLDTNRMNRGLFFDAELVPFCGGTYRVKTRVNKFIDEKTGKMKSTKTPAVMLEGVWCQSRYSNCRMFCPRSIHSWWREIWLERVPESHQRTQSG
jgi:hypothetical protein